jgi:hypothetical protein
MKVQRWVSFLLIMLIEYYTAKRCAQIQFMKLQIELLWERLDRSRVNAHWCFDHGLWSLSDDYRVLVGIDRFTEASPDGRTLASYHGQRLHLPADEGLRPNQVHLAWHRKKHGYG